MGEHEPISVGDGLLAARVMQDQEIPRSDDIDQRVRKTLVEAIRCDACGKALREIVEFAKHAPDTQADTLAGLLKDALEQYHLHI